MRIITILTIILLGTSSTNTAEAQLLPTKLRITVIDGLGNFVEGATVSIYESEKDYLASEDAIATLTTDNKGRVTFKGMESMIYFVEAGFEGKNNNAAGVKTSKLADGRLNKVNTIIE